ncbi:MAG: hypothetical protein ACOC2W_02880 [bacterium]
MENYKWYSENGNLFELHISEQSDRFNGEGIHQEVKLSYKDGYLIWDIYETSYGRIHALNYFKELEIYNLEYYNLDDEVDVQNFNSFKNWLIESLTPIEIKRVEKIEKIKSNLQ